MYRRLTSKHKDLPENIIEKLANDAARNNYIVSEYINNKDIYGKTLIFADRWFQCEYIVEKLMEQGIRANAIYSKIENSDSLFSEGKGRRSNKDNEKIMQDFRDGKYDVIVNVKMLTEGVDVPDVKTVMITRQTTSPILFTQMVGRALRGEKAGGGSSKDNANIVLFMDHWERLLPFVKPGVGGQEDIHPVVQGRNPYETISIHLVKLACADIDFDRIDPTPYLSYIPVGWYAAEYTAAIEENGNEEFVSCMDSIVVYDFNHENYEKMIESLNNEKHEDWANESFEDEELMGQAISYAEKFFDSEDNFDGNLHLNIIKIMRHIGQNGTKPEFMSFDQRNRYDLDRIAQELIDTPQRECHTILKNLFNDEGMLWQVLYRNFTYFKRAFDNSMNRILGEDAPIPVTQQTQKKINPLTNEIKQQVFKRDNFQCLCCGKERRKGVSLEIDHILPIAMGGKNVPSNLQTLCKHCNGLKGVNEIDYRVIVSPLSKPKEMIFYDCPTSDYIENYIARVVNHIYHCRAFCSLDYSVRRNGKNYETWQINLYNGNNPEWLVQHSAKLLEFINYDLGWEHVKQIGIKS